MVGCVILQLLSLHHNNFVGSEVAVGQDLLALLEAFLVDVLEVFVKVGELGGFVLHFFNANL